MYIIFSTFIILKIIILIITVKYVLITVVLITFNMSNPWQFSGYNLVFLLPKPRFDPGLGSKILQAALCGQKNIHIYCATVTTTFKTFCHTKQKLYFH